jgi:hypothetical protein
MSLRDVLEYRAAGTADIVFDLGELPRDVDQQTVYARPFGATEWGWYSGPFVFDADYLASHEEARRG